MSDPTPISVITDALATIDATPLYRAIDVLTSARALDRTGWLPSWGDDDMLAAAVVVITSTEAPTVDPTREWTPEQIADLVTYARNHQYAMANALASLAEAQYPGMHPAQDEALRRGRVAIAAGKLAALVGGGR